MYKKYLKRIIDLALAIISLPFFSAIYLFVAPLIYLNDRGPVFYIADRLGKDGRIFRMFKFRSMILNAPDIRNEDGSTFSSEDDPRLTKIGKFIRKTSIDETPQLLNILKGDMSIIGPRPDLPEAIDSYSDIEIKKLAVRPGITGYSQAYFRNSISAAEKFRNDVYYVENISFLLDIRIFFKTIASVFIRKNIFSSESIDKQDEISI